MIRTRVQAARTRPWPEAPGGRHDKTGYARDHTTILMCFTQCAEAVRSSMEPSLENRNRAQVVCAKMMDLSLGIHPFSWLLIPVCAIMPPTKGANARSGGYCIARVIGGPASCGFPTVREQLLAAYILNMNSSASQVAPAVLIAMIWLRQTHERGRNGRQRSATRI